MDIPEADEAGRNGSGQLRVVMWRVRLLLRLILHDDPGAAVHGRFHDVRVIQTLLSSVCVGLVVVIVDLKRPDRDDLFKIDLQPLAGSLVFRHPEASHVLVGDVMRPMARKVGRRFDRLLVERSIQPVNSPFLSGARVA